MFRRHDAATTAAICACASSLYALHVRHRKVCNFIIITPIITWFGNVRGDDDMRARVVHSTCVRFMCNIYANNVSPALGALARTAHTALGCCLLSCCCPLKHACLVAVAAKKACCFSTHTHAQAVPEPLSHAATTLRLTNCICLAGPREHRTRLSWRAQWKSVSSWPAGREGLRSS